MSERIHIPIGGSGDYASGGGGSGAPPALSDLEDVSGTPGVGKAPVYNTHGMAMLTPVSTTADVDAILAGVAAVNWRPLVLDNARLTPFGQGFADPRYRLTLNNVVHIEGMIACNPPLTDEDAGLVIAQVDADSLPGAKLLFGCPAYGNNARVDILEDGTIAFYGMLMGGGEVDWFSLSGISYSVGAAA